MQNKSILEDEFYSPQEIAKKLKVHEITVYRWIKTGKLKTIKTDQKHRIPARWLKEFLGIRESEEDE